MAWTFLQFIFISPSSAESIKIKFYRTDIIILMYHFENLYHKLYRNASNANITRKLGLFPSNCFEWLVLRVGSHRSVFANMAIFELRYLACKIVSVETLNASVSCLFSSTLRQNWRSHRKRQHVVYSRIKFEQNTLVLFAEVITASFDQQRYNTYNDALNTSYPERSSSPADSVKFS